MIDLKQVSGTRYDYETVVKDIDFDGTTAEEDVEIDIGTTSREVLRGRLYIDEDPGAFAAWCDYSFYSKAAKSGPDALWRASTKLVYTELEVATTGSDANITPDAHEDFNPHDLAYILDTGDEEFIRLMTIADTMIAEDTIAAHAINDGLVRVSEFSGFQLANTEDGTSVWLRVGFAALTTVSLKMELLLRY